MGCGKAVAEHVRWVTVLEIMQDNYVDTCTINGCGILITIEKPTHASIVRNYGRIMVDMWF